MSAKWGHFSVFLYCWGLIIQSQSHMIHRQVALLDIIQGVGVAKFLDPYITVEGTVKILWDCSVIFYNLFLPFRNSPPEAMVWTRLDLLSNLGIPSLWGWCGYGTMMISLEDQHHRRCAAQENPSAEVLSQQLTSLLLCASETNGLVIRGEWCELM